MPYARGSFGLLLGCLGACALLLGGAVWALSRAIAALSGWSALAARYRCGPGADPGRTASAPSARLRWVRYGALLAVRTSERGLYLALDSIPGHPALLIPWTETEVVLYSRRGLPRVMVRFTALTGVALSVGGAGVAAIAGYCERGRDGPSRRPYPDHR